MNLSSLFKSKKKSSFSPFLCPLPHCGIPKTLSLRVENNDNIFNSQRLYNNVDDDMVDKMVEGLKIEKDRFFFEAGEKTSSIMKVSSSILAKSNNELEILPIDESCVITPIDSMDIPCGEGAISIRDQVSSSTLSNNTNNSGKQVEYLPFNDSCIIKLSSSMDPYGSFKKSMVKMVEANLGIKDWNEFLEEMLAWYLEVNEKNNHKYIIGAFCDLWISYSFTSSTTNIPNSFLFSSSEPKSVISPTSTSFVIS
uniref:Transcription repressor n=1 Tax=Solanum lycopersicum TaxID=4081 RepID=A0A3Q7JG07_SOLLC